MRERLNRLRLRATYFPMEELIVLSTREKDNPRGAASILETVIHEIGHVYYPEWTETQCDRFVTSISKLLGVWVLARKAEYR